MIKKQTGQAILALILIMTVALAIGLSVVQKSLVDVSTSTKVEESSRAFSAAEAGIEKALQPGSTCGANCISFSENSSKADVAGGNLIPCIPGSPGCTEISGQQQAPLEYPPLAREEVAHFWLADFTSTLNPPSQFYNPPNHTLDVYWGDSAFPSDKAALELTLVFYNGTKYDFKKWYLDQASAIRNPPPIGFDTVPCSGDNIITSTVADPTTCASSQVTYQCKVTLGSLPSNMMLLRARLLYNTNSQPLAVQATGSGGTCTGLTGNGCYIPPQARAITSTGASGETQRKVKVCQVNKVVPPYFDYAIFSVGAISK